MHGRGDRVLVAAAAHGDSYVDLAFGGVTVDASAVRVERGASEWSGHW